LHKKLPIYFQLTYLSLTPNKWRLCS